MHVLGFLVGFAFAMGVYFTDMLVEDGKKAAAK